MRSIHRLFAVLLLSILPVLPLCTLSAGETTPQKVAGHLPSPSEIQRSVQWEIDLLTKNCTECGFYVTYGRVTQTDKSQLETGLVYVRYPGFFHRIMKLRRDNIDIIMVLWPLGIRDTQFEKFLNKVK